MEHIFTTLLVADWLAAKLAISPRLLVACLMVAAGHLTATLLLLASYGLCWLVGIV